MATQDVSTANELGRVYDGWHSAHSVAAIDRRQRAFFGWILDLVSPAADDRLLDIACGNGGFSP